MKDPIPVTVVWDCETGVYSLRRSRRKDTISAFLDESWIARFAEVQAAWETMQKHLEHIQEFGVPNPEKEEEEHFTEIGNRLAGKAYPPEDDTDAA